LVGGGLQQAAPELLIHPGMGDGGGAKMGADEFFVIADETIDFLLGRMPFSTNRPLRARTRCLREGSGFSPE
jgi:hypothetical protein